MHYLNTFAVHLCGFGNGICFVELIQGKNVVLNSVFMIACVAGSAYNAMVMYDK